MRTTTPGQSPLLLLDVIEILSKINVSYAIIGAFAASFYGVVRASMDTDAIIYFDDSKHGLQNTVKALTEAGLQVNHRTGDFDDPIAAVINVEDTFKNRVDLLFGIKGMKEDALTRTNQANFQNSSIKIISMEDLIAMKIFAGSSKDINDAIGIIKISADKINLSLLKELTANYGKDVHKEFEDLWKQYGM